MAEYIDKSVAVNIMNAKADMGVCGDYAVCYHNAAKMLEKLPGANVAPLRRGRWEWTDRDVPKYHKYFRCSECHMMFMDGVTGAIAPEYGRRVWKFCPYCGALMGGGADNG